MKEFELIEKIFKPLTKGHAAAQNLADDTARFSLQKNEELVVSKDIYLEDVHFLRSDGGFKIASKLLLTNISDLASAGATPLYYMLGFSFNKNLGNDFCKEFARGLKKVQEQYKLGLIGGDTISSKKLFFSVTIFGKIKKGETMLRQNAKEGDLIFVSGNIGDAFLGLKKRFTGLSAAEKNYLSNRHFFPTPRIELGKKLAQKKLAKCAADISDGLLSDLRHICIASKLKAEILLDEIPFSAAAKKTKNDLLELMSAGDDYELVFTAAKKDSQKIFALAKELKQKISCIGEMKKSSKPGIELLDSNGKKIPIKKFGYEHS